MVKEDKENFNKNILISIEIVSLTKAGPIPVLFIVSQYPFGD